MNSLRSLCLAGLLLAVGTPNFQAYGQALSNEVGSAVKVNEPAALPTYSIRYATKDEVVIDITPQYSFSRVVGKEGGTFTEVRFSGSQLGDAKAGAAGIPVLYLPLLLPGSANAKVEILSRTDSTVSNIDLAPVPSYSRNQDGTMVPGYQVDPNEYSVAKNTIELTAPSLFRTAYTQKLIVAPVNYDAPQKRLTLAKQLTVRITFNQASVREAQPHSFSQAEQDFYRTAFINGNISEFYRSGITRIAAMLPKYGSFKKGVQATEEASWLQVRTDSEGVYRITSQDLTNAGVKTPIDASSIQLFGTGGKPLEETPSTSSGELKENAIQIINDGNGAFKELRFYAPGIITWEYNKSTSNLVNSFTHTINPYTSEGHFLLKVGGEPMGEVKRIQAVPDQITDNPVAASSVLAMGVHETERIFEIPNISREFLGETIPKGASQDINLEELFSGFAGGEILTRVAVNTRSNSAHQVILSLDGDSAMTIYGSQLSSGGDTYAFRSWNNVLSTNSNSVPKTLSLTLQSAEIESQAWLNYVEVFYQRKTIVGKQSLPFVLANEEKAFHYEFTQSSNGALWDVTDNAEPKQVAASSGDVIAADVQSDATNGRRLIAFSGASLRSARMNAISAPSLRSTIGERGATDIIVAPRSLEAAARKLKALRELGGEATEPMKTEVVFVEDIFREFGYGTNDPVAIRDFCSYVFRHASVSGVAPMFLTLLGNGHVDYQQRTTSTPNLIPIYQSDYGPNNRSAGITGQGVFPDEGFFTAIFTGEDPDFGVGRITVANEEEADAVVEKLKHYEHGSAQGLWRATASFVADDRIYEQGDADPLDHFADTETEIGQLQDRVLVNKVYEVSYPTVFTSLGRRKPEAQRAMIDAFNEGSVLLSYVGHGNPKVWSHESLLEVPSTINKFVNWDKLAFVTTATCDFSEFDDYFKNSGGMQMLTKPDGAAISLLGTSRSVTGGEPLVTEFYRSLFNVPCDGLYGTSNIGSAYVAGRLRGRVGFKKFYVILGDPALRLLVPKRYVVIDSINGGGVNNKVVIPALSEVRIKGRITTSCDGNESTDRDFDGSAIVTLFDARTELSKVTTYNTGSTHTDNFTVEGPILYRGNVSVKGGEFSASFIIPKDIKFDTSAAKVHVIAYAKDTRSALGASENMVLAAADSASLAQAAKDTSGPALHPFIGSRRFRSGDVVSMNNVLIVDVNDLHGLNTSTAGVGHSFIAWIDDSTEGAIDLASGYVSKQDNFSEGTSTIRTKLPKGKHTLHVRAFDALDNPTYAQVEFIAKDENPFHLYNVTNSPNPVRDHTVFSFTQPAGSDDPVDVVLSIYSTDGRKLRELTATSITDNVVQIYWDGLDNAQHQAANGAYVYNVQVTTRTGVQAMGSGSFILQH